MSKWQRAFLLLNIFDLYGQLNYIIIAGRKNLSEKLNEQGYNITQSQIRTKLNFLEDNGYIIKKRGKNGTTLTKKGLDILVK